MASYAHQREMGNRLHGAFVSNSSEGCLEFDIHKRNGGYPRDDEYNVFSKYLYQCLLKVL